MARRRDKTLARVLVAVSVAIAPTAHALTGLTRCEAVKAPAQRLPCHTGSAQSKTGDRVETKAHARCCCSSKPQLNASTCGCGHSHGPMQLAAEPAIPAAERAAHPILRTNHALQLRPRLQSRGRSVPKPPPKRSLFSSPA